MPLDYEYFDYCQITFRQDLFSITLTMVFFLIKLHKGGRPERIRTI